MTRHAAHFGAAMAGLTLDSSGQQIQLAGLKLGAGLDDVMLPPSYAVHRSGPLRQFDTNRAKPLKPLQKQSSQVIDFYGGAFQSRQWEFLMYLCTISNQYQVAWNKFLHTDHYERLPNALKAVRRKRNSDGEMVWVDRIPRWEVSHLRDAVRAFRSTGDRVPISLGHARYGKSYGGLEIGGIKLVVTKGGRNGVIANSAFLAKAPADQGDAIWVGVLVGVYELKAPTVPLPSNDDEMLVVDVEWYTAKRSDIHKPTGVLMLSKSKVTPPNGRLWSASDIVPTRIWLTDCPWNTNKLMVMHRDSRLFKHV